MKKVLLTPRAFHNYGEHAVELLKNKGYQPIVNDTGKQLSSEEFAKLANEAYGIVIGVDLLDEVLLEECKNLKAVVKFGVGTDNIDVRCAEKLGISVGKTVGTNSTSVAEFTIGLMFDCARQITISADNVKNGGWTKLTGSELQNKTIGIVGFGNIGQEVARIAKGIGMNVLAYDAYHISDDVLNKYHATSADLNELLEKSDFITLHVPLTSETYHFISRKEFDLMKETACLINVSRGGVVDEEALLEALKNKKIASSAADVFSDEPPKPDTLTKELLSMDNFLLTPHVGSRTVDSEVRTIDKSIEVLLSFLENQLWRVLG